MHVDSNRISKAASIKYSNSHPIIHNEHNNNSIIRAINYIRSMHTAIQYQRLQQSNTLSYPYIGKHENNNTNIKRVKYKMYEESDTE